MGTRYHKCDDCLFGMNLSGETTQDYHPCNKFHKATKKQLYVDYTGNTRVYKTGLVTEDNGMGYDVINCPYYKSITKKGE